MESTTGKPLQVLLIEDDPADAALTQEILSEGLRAPVVTHLDHGKDALPFLRREGSHSDAVRPDLVLLDLNLPGLGGREILTAIKSDDSLKEIPVVLLTTSSNPQDVKDLYALGANSYVVKPIDLEGFEAAVRGIEQFWLRHAQLPGS